MSNLETGSYVSDVTMYFSRKAPLRGHMQGHQDQDRGREVAPKLFHLGPEGA